jgi:hypothetical protein
MGVFAAAVRQRCPYRVALWLLLTGYVSGHASAQEWFSVKMPVRQQAVDGFTCQISMIDSDADGYVPLRFRALPTGGSFAGTRALVLKVTPEPRANWPRPRTEYRLEIELTARATSYNRTFYLPKKFSGQAFRFELFDLDGPLASYAAEIPGNRPVLADASLSYRDIFPRCAVLVPDAGPGGAGADAPPAWRRVPDLRTLAAIDLPEADYLEATSVQRLNDAEATRFLRRETPICGQLLTPSTAHDGWLGYESIDVVIAAYPLLEQLRSDYPRRYEALRQWLSTGGVLWTFAAPEAGELADFFGVRRTEANPAEVAEALATSVAARRRLVESPQRYWMKYARYNRERRVAGDFYSLDENQLWNQLQRTQHPAAEAAAPAELAEQLVPLPLGAGIAVGIRLDDPFPGGLEFWHAVRHLSGSRQVWQYRRGTSLVHGSSNYWDWLLANVARPPVYVFLGLLSVFVLLVGPISYYFTRRAQRTYLMFIIAPILATFATLVLFGYGLIADGFGVQSRVRQITWVEEGSGRAATQTRATYFAAFRRDEGLVFPAEAATYPLVDALRAYQRNESREQRFDRLITLEGTRRRWSGEYFPPRAQRQFISYQPQQMSGRLELRGNAEETPRVVNRFAVPLRELLVRDAEGLYWQWGGAGLEAGESTTLRRVPASDAAPRLRELYRRHQPEPPYGYRPTRSSFRFSMWANDLDDLQWWQQASWSGSNDASGVFEAQLQNLLADRAALPRGWFVALGELDSRQLGDPNVRQVDSVHYLMGSLQ